ncbi:MAG: phosphatase PAP2 family protein [Proteobacteria bacterium]|nr:phosphatase PAP2 family protein [Pseudomonadota bacterium]NDC24908.1 phosphatase PAP2 family protein [Pseudomonadota bacterium]NDD04768.1 phosphatase PAP2 family protein [Pseudomonadota bacterium]NDG26510.1 phosphatase PAP2 family protein [Pseudomonadota bacterium]
MKKFFYPSIKRIKGIQAPEKFNCMIYLKSCGILTGVSAAQNLDLMIFRAVNSISGPAWLEDLALLLSSSWMWWLVFGAFLMGAVFFRKTRLLKTLLVCVFALIVSDVVSARLLKPTIKRYRPCYQLEVNVRTIKCGSQYGMPSSHAANAAAVLAVTAAVFGLFYLWAGGILALLVGLSRIYLGVHFPADILVGFMVGSSLGWLVLLLVKKISTWPVFRTRFLQQN